VTGGWKKLHKEELHNLYSSSRIRRMGWVVHVAQKGEKGYACRILVGSPEGKRPLTG
jgi:hypothetical protein